MDLSTPGQFLLDLVGYQLYLYPCLHNFLEQKHGQNLSMPLGNQKLIPRNDHKCIYTNEGSTSIHMKAGGLGVSLFVQVETIEHSSRMSSQTLVSQIQLGSTNIILPQIRGD